MNSKANYADRVKKQAEKAREDFIKSIGETDDQIYHRVSAILDKHFQQIVEGSIGLKRSWGGEYEISRVNGHVPPLDRALTEKIQRAATDILDKAIAEYKPSAKVIRAIQKEYEEGLLQASREAGITAANRFVDSVISESTDGAPAE